MSEEKKELTLEEQLVETKKQLTVYKRKLTQMTNTMEEWKDNYDRLKDFHEGPNREGQNKERYAEKRAFENIERKWPDLARAIAMYVDPESYLLLKDSIPRMASPYSGGKYADTAYNKLVKLIDDELHSLWQTVQHKYRKK